LTREQVEATLAEDRDELDRVATPGVTAVLYSPTRIDPHPSDGARPPSGPGG
jgi:hypothetical protein